MALENRVVLKRRYDISLGNRSSEGLVLRSMLLKLPQKKTEPRVAATITPRSISFLKRYSQSTGSACALAILESFDRRIFKEVFRCEIMGKSTIFAFYRICSWVNKLTNYFFDTRKRLLFLKFGSSEGVPVEFTQRLKNCRSWKFSRERSNHKICEIRGALS